MTSTATPESADPAAGGSVETSTDGRKEGLHNILCQLSGGRPGYLNNTGTETLRVGCLLDPGKAIEEEWKFQRHGANEVKIQSVTSNRWLRWEFPEGGKANVQTSAENDDNCIWRLWSAPSSDNRGAFTIAPVSYHKYSIAFPDDVGDVSLAQGNNPSSRWQVMKINDNIDGW